MVRYLKKCIGSTTRAASDPDFLTLEMAARQLGHSWIDILKVSQITCSLLPTQQGSSRAQCPHPGWRLSCVNLTHTHMFAMSAGAADG
jgi:hypothetical protein